MGVEDVAWFGDQDVDVAIVGLAWGFDRALGLGIEAAERAEEMVTRVTVHSEGHARRVKRWLLVRESETSHFFCFSGELEILRRVSADNLVQDGVSLSGSK